MLFILVTVLLLRLFPIREVSPEKILSSSDFSCTVSSGLYFSHSGTTVPTFLVLKYLSSSNY